MSDPFIARLPAWLERGAGPGPGHIYRKTPTDYLAYVVGKAATVADENLRGLLRDVAYAARAEPLFTRHRFAAIWRLNTGHHSDLDLSEHQGTRHRPMVSERIHYHLSLGDLAQTPKADGAHWQPVTWRDPHLLPRMFNAAHITVDKPRFATELQLSLSHMEDYEIHVNGARIATIERVGPSGRFKNHTVRLPRPTVVDTISIYVLGRHKNRAFSIGHLFVR